MYNHHLSYRLAPYSIILGIMHCTIVPLQGLTQVEEMLISPVLPIMSLYRLPRGQYAYSGHEINLPQDVATFTNSLPRLPSELDVIIVRKEGAGDTHRDFHCQKV